jgi:ABC-type multidrug transport system ATPase subunit
LTQRKLDSVRYFASMNLLNVNGITKRYGTRAVLQDVNFSVRQGEVLGLIGPNGAGKTTLFECLAGILPSDGGTISNDTRTLAPAQRKTTLFYLPDGITPWAQQSVSWALGFFERLYASTIKAAELLNALKLESLQHARIGSLSKGERKRTLLALSLLTPQPLLLLDEPFDGLDLRQTRDVMALLRAQTAAPRRTLMLSIHQLTDAARVCDRLVLLSGGRVVGDGTLDELRVAAQLPEGGLEEVFLALT